MDKTLICFYALALVIMILLGYLFGIFSVSAERTAKERKDGKNLVRIYVMNMATKRLIVWASAIFEVVLYAFCIGVGVLNWIETADCSWGTQRAVIAAVLAAGPIIGVLFALLISLMVEAGIWCVAHRIEEAYADSRDWSTKTVPVRLSVRAGLIPFGYKIDVMAPFRNRREEKELEKARAIVASEDA